MHLNLRAQLPTFLLQCPIYLLLARTMECDVIFQCPSAVHQGKHTHEFEQLIKYVFLILFHCFRVCALAIQIQKAPINIVRRIWFCGIRVGISEIGFVIAFSAVQFSEGPRVGFFQLFSILGFFTQYLVSHKRQVEAPLNPTLRKKQSQNLFQKFQHVQWGLFRPNSQKKYSSTK